MVEIIKTATFDHWLISLRDARAKAKVHLRIDRLALGNPGDAEPVGEGISEMRIDYGPGYRVYYLRRRPLVIVLLCGGDKASQKRDIKAAKRIATDWRN